MMIDFKVYPLDCKYEDVIKGTVNSFVRPIADLFDKIGRPNYNIESTSNLIEDILSLLTPSFILDIQLEEYGNRLATISNAELCYIWFIVMKDYLVKKNPIAVEEDINELLVSRYNHLRMKSNISSIETTFFGIECIEYIREEKNNLKEAIIRAQEGILRHLPGSEWGMLQSNYGLLIPLPECISSLTSSIIWERFFHDKMESWVVDVYEEAVNNHFGRRKCLSEYYEDLPWYCLHIVLEHIPIEDMKKMWNIAKMKWSLKEDT